MEEYTSLTLGIIQNYVFSSQWNFKFCDFEKCICCYTNLFIEIVTTQRYNEITFVSSSSALLHVSAFHEAIIRQIHLRSSMAIELQAIYKIYC
jgi:hypothetical protein